MYSMGAIVNIVSELFSPLRRQKPKVSEKRLDRLRGRNVRDATVPQGFPSGQCRRVTLARNG
jgi:hypothetical protein